MRSGAKNWNGKTPSLASVHVQRRRAQPDATHARIAESQFLQSESGQSLERFAASTASRFSSNL